jgi:hypothetical protein
MDFTIENQLITYLNQLGKPQQERVLQFAKELVEGDESDFADTLSNKQIASIKRGLQEVREGQTVSHEEVRKRYNKWL